jgi:hypothetical protein
MMFGVNASATGWTSAPCNQTLARFCTPTRNGKQGIKIGSVLIRFCLHTVDFQVMRRTHATLSHKAGIDPKVQADQRGHGIGVAMEVYTKTTTEARAEAARQLEESVRRTECLM